MIRKLDIFIPDLLKKIDKNLLLNQPGIWSTKIHFVAFYVLAAMSFSTLLAWIQVDIKELSDPENHLVFMFVPAAIGLIFWVFRVVKFNVERGFGISSGIEMFKKQVIYGLCILMFASLPFYYGYMVSHFNAESVSDKQLVEEVNIVNLAYANLTYKPNQPAPPYSNWTPVTLSSPLDGYMTTGRELYIKWNRMTLSERINHLDKYQEILKKYSTSRYYEQDSQEMMTTFYNTHNLGNLAGVRSFYETKSALDQINRAKRNHNNRNNYSSTDVSVFLFMAFLTWLAVMIAIRTSRKHSLTAIVTTIVGFFAAGLILSMTRLAYHGNSDELVGLMFFGAFAFLLLQSFSRKNSQKINFWKSVGLIIAVGMTPFIFIVWEGFIGKGIDTETVTYGGIILSFVLWNLVYNRQFVSLRSAPSQD